MNINNTKDRVESLLNQHSKLQDSDNMLIGYVWHLDLADIGISTKRITATDLLIHLRDGDLTSAEAITRARRKLQEENPHLRGAKYAMRHNEQTHVQEQLGYNTQQIHMFND